MSVVDAPPPIPTEFQIYDSYEVDPTYQRKFSAIWAAVAGAAIILSLPHLLSSIRKGYTLASITGVTEDLSGKEYEPVSTHAWRGADEKVKSSRRLGRVYGLLAKLRSFAMWMAPHVGLDLGQVFLVVAYFIVLLLCITLHSELVDNPNRAGFMALAQLPVVFLLATKNSILSVALGAGHGWEKLNFLHRWSGRGLFLSAAVHGSLWIRNHLQYGLPILGQQKETSGVACLGLLCAIVLTSLKPVRVWCYQVFLVLHVLGFAAFFITICYHTIYARPWVYPPLAFYGLDLLLRLFRFRVKDATLVAVDQRMTLIRVQDCDGGWSPGQHIRLRVFFNGRIFESHPLTVCNASPAITCLNERGQILLGARANGDWSKALNVYAKDNSTIGPSSEKRSQELDTVAKKEDDTESDIAIISSSTEELDWTSMDGAPVQVMLDGPYGGSSIDLGEYERILLLAGGSGATFTLGVLDDIVGRCVRRHRSGGERTRRIEFAWCMRSFGCLRWFAPQLTQIALLAEQDPSLDVHISVFVTCLCDPEAVPPIPNCDINMERPTAYQLLSDLVDSSESSPERSESGKGSSSERFRLNGGGLAVCAAGPESMSREAKNALARLSLWSGSRLGKVGCHTEVYSI